MKYVVMDHINIYMFGRNVGHADFAAQIGGRCTSAGFVNLTTMECYGFSESLALFSAPTDTKLLRMLVPGATPLAMELKTIRAELGDALHELSNQAPLPLQAAHRRLTGLIPSIGQ